MKKVTLSDALSHFKTKTALAKALGISLAAVSKWKEPLSDRIESRIAMALIRSGKHKIKGINQQ
jgi:hypothetical protein